MDVYISDQLTALLVFVALGIISGLVYDILRTVRCVMVDGDSRKEKTAAFFIDIVLDLIYMCALALSSVILTYCYSYGKLRLFCIIAFCISFAVYRITLGKLYSVTVRPFIFKLKQMVLYVISMIAVPIKKLLKFFVSFILWVYALSLGRLVLRIRHSRIESRFRHSLEQLNADIIF